MFATSCDSTSRRSLTDRTALLKCIDQTATCGGRYANPTGVEDGS